MKGQGKCNGQVAHSLPGAGQRSRGHPAKSKSSSQAAKLSAPRAPCQGHSTGQKPRHYTTSGTTPLLAGPSLGKTSIRFRCSFKLLGAGRMLHSAKGISTRVRCESHSTVRRRSPASRSWKISKLGKTATG
jgi:hypothetical protein